MDLPADYFAVVYRLTSDISVTETIRNFGNKRSHLIETETEELTRPKSTPSN